MQLIVLKYFIRRFCRIYVPFFIFCSLIKGVSLRFIGMYASYTSSWSSMITLQSTGFTHLWTIAPEIKYYFFIPAFVVASVKLNTRFRMAWLIANITLCLSIECFNLFRQTRDDFKLPKGHVFTTRFTVFYLGSILALAYDYLEKWDVFFNKFKLTLGMISCVVFVKTLKYGSISYNRDLNEYTHLFKSGVHMTLIYLLMLTGDENFFTNIFKNSFLKRAGKYSFGIYLWHPMCLIEVSRYMGRYFAYKSELLLVAFGVSFLAGALFFYLIEKPLMKLANSLCLKLAESSYFSQTLSDV